MAAVAGITADEPLGLLVRQAYNDLPAWAAGKGQA